MADSARGRIFSVQRRGGVQWADTPLQDYFQSNRLRALKRVAEAKDAIWENAVINDDFVARIINTTLWNAFGTAPTIINERNGIAQFQTTGTSGLDFTGQLIVRPSQGIRCAVRVKLVDTTQITVEFGVKVAANGGAASANFIIFRYSNSGNWNGLTNDGTTTTTTDLGTGVSTTAYQDLWFEMPPTADYVDFLINGTRSGRNTATLPAGTTDMQPHLFLASNDASQKTGNVDYYRLAPMLR